MYDTYGIPLGCGGVKKSTMLRSRVDLYRLKILFVFSAVYLTGGVLQSVTSLQVILKQSIMAILHNYCSVIVRYCLLFRPAE